MVEYKAAQAGRLQVFYATDASGFNEETSVWVDVPATTPGANGRIQAPVKVDRRATRLTDIRFDLQTDLGATIELASVRLLQSEQSLWPLGGRLPGQHDHLQRLPWVWASLDPLDAVQNTDIMATLVEQPVVLHKQQEYNLRLPADAHDGKYLHLRLSRAPSDDDVDFTITYGTPVASSFRLEVLAGDAERHVLVPSLKPVTNNVRLENQGDRLWLAAEGRDAYVHRF